MIGKKFGRLVVTDEYSNGKYRFLTCVCECGVVKNYYKSNVLAGKSLSCGCLRAERTIAALTTHGMSNTKEYSGYVNMKNRMLNPNYEDFDRYAGRGLTLEPEWEHNFPAFLSHIGFAPVTNETWSVGRINNNIGYVVGNVRWETLKQQARIKGMVVTNTTGVNGVSYRDGKRFVAHWVDLGGVEHSRSFSIKKYGYDGAFNLACEHRSKAIEDLNFLGAGYSAEHGLPRINYILEKC